jgi:undecaprenol kinase
VTESAPRIDWNRKFSVAWAGIRSSWRTQASLRVHIVCTPLVLVLAAVSRLGPLQWAVLLFAIGLVISMELLNTAIEAVVDLCSPEHSELAREAKDAAAGAVLVASITAVLVGASVFLPVWLALLKPNQ